MSSSIASIDACAAHYGADEQAMRDYLLAGEQKALAMDNRGPVRFDDDGNVHPDILSAYDRYGFYVFTGVLAEDELADLRADMADIQDRLPTERGAKTDQAGRPALSTGCKSKTLQWARPLSDPLGGTKLLDGRHQVKLHEPSAASDAPPEVVYVILGSLQFSDACLRTYGHPDLLRVAAAVNGDDFVPFNDVLFIKDAGLGAAVSWHQDGITHWDNPALDGGTHGFNFMAQVYGSTAVNGVWVVPGTHKMGKVDITQLVAAAGSERLQDAVPLICDPGDVVICNRQLVHGSFANTGFERRVTVNFGFHRRASVEGVTANGMNGEGKSYDAAWIAERSRMIPLAVSARSQRFGDEKPYSYAPLADTEDAPRWDSQNPPDLTDYNLLDLYI